MDVRPLVQMINQIARHFEHADDPVQATFAHVKDFWDPRMIAGLLTADCPELGPVAKAAADKLREFERS